VQKKLGYWSAQLTGGNEKIQPNYDYTFLNNNRSYQSFVVNEASLNLRYASAETSSPFLGRYYSNGTKYPVLYGRIIAGKITNANIKYTQLIGGISWQKNINRIGKERFLLLSGISFSKQPLPLSKLFAGNGFLVNNTSVYVFGGMETMLPYQFYSDRFINFYWLHQFNRPFFHVKLGRGLDITPSPAIAYNALLGSLANPEVHSKVNFLVPDKGYQESGLLLNGVIRLKMLGLYNVLLKLGYFHNVPVNTSAANKGRLVYGVGIDL
jgi:hypothetical protein